MTTVRVLATDHPATLARSLRDEVLNGRDVDLWARSPSAVNQAVKAISAAHRMLAEHGIEIVFQPSFLGIACDWNTTSGIRLAVQRR